MTIFLCIMFALLVLSMGKVEIKGATDRTRHVMAFAFYASHAVVALAVLGALAVIEQGWP